MNTQNEINVCFACDDNYAKYAGVSIASILANAKEDEKINVYILDDNISEQKKEEINSLKSIHDCNINFINVNEELFESFKSIQTHSYITIAAYYRLKMPSLIPDIDKIIYFDCDIIINSSLKDLFNTNLENYSMAGVNDIDSRKIKLNPNYVNSGMLVLNLKKWRNDNTEKRLEDYTIKNSKTIKLGDQEILNEALKGEIKLVDETYNVQSSNFTNRSSYTNKPKIIHYTAKRKPWHFGSFSCHRDLYFKYLELTPWKIPPKERFYWYQYNKIATLFMYLKYRPLFFLRPRFYKALFLSYIKPIFAKED